MESSTQQKVTAPHGREGFQWEHLEQQRHQLLGYLLGVWLALSWSSQLLAAGRASFSARRLNHGLGGSVGAKGASVLAKVGNAGSVSPGVGTGCVLQERR